MEFAVFAEDAEGVEASLGVLNGKDSTTTGDVKAPSWPDDPTTETGKVEAWSHGGGAPWQSASFDAETNTIIVGAGNPGPWNTWARTSKDGNPHDFDSLYTSGQVGSSGHDGALTSPVVVLSLPLRRPMWPSTKGRIHTSSPVSGSRA